MTVVFSRLAEHRTWTKDAMTGSMSRSVNSFEAMSAAVMHIARMVRPTAMLHSIVLCSWKAAALMQPRCQGVPPYLVCQHGQQCPGAGDRGCVLSSKQHGYEHASDLLISGVPAIVG